MALVLFAAALFCCAVHQAVGGAWGTAGLAGAAAAGSGTPAAARLLLGRRLVVVTVRGVSMWPTYRDQDRVLVHRRLPVAGDVVVIERPGNFEADWADARPSMRPRPPSLPSQEHWLIKRVVAVTGDPVPRDVSALASQAGDHVPAGCLVLIGDNRRASIDSRSLGYFRTDRVLGVVVRLLPRRTH
ncbi:S26 family signal peptidase [Streptomyces sp. NPDC047725]|uniref:S26 family signal peptidase n=1 Tax=Streptomyces sp. NPDC047725 TaxID=3365487 RepID=UPI003721B437